MTREDLAYEVTRIMGGSKKDSYAYIDAVMEGIKLGMKRDGQVRINGFGTLQSVLTPSHESRNPKTGEKLDWVNADHDCAIYTAVPVEEKTGEKVIVPDRYYPKAKFTKGMKDYLNS